MDVSLREGWISADFERARDQDISRWLEKELARPSALGSHDLLVATMAEAGIPWSVAIGPKGRVPVEENGAGGARAGAGRLPGSPIESISTETAWSPRRLNRLAASLGASTYLEIGVARGDTFRAVKVADRTGVDPAFGFDTLELVDEATSLHEITSDQFFQSLPPAQTFDLVFLDGLHTFEQTYRDLCNVLIHSHPRTVVLIDDTKPSDVYSALRDFHKAIEYRSSAGSANSDTSWHGDTFKVVFALHDFHPGLDYRTIVGSGNPQTLVWRSTRGWRSPALESMESISRLSYFDLLESIQVLRESPEDDAIDRCVRELGSGSKAPFQTSKITIDVVEPAIVDRNVLLGRTIEQPRTPAAIDTNHLVISGWVVGREAAVKRVNVNSGNTTLEWMPVNLDRPDVVTAFPQVDHARSAGFRGALVLPLGRFELELEAVLADGTTHPLGSLAGEVSAP